MKRLSALILCMIMLLSVLPVFSFGEDAKLTVSFSNDLPGSAAGSYTFTAEEKGKYGFYWTNENGEKLTTVRGEKTLSYSAIDSFSVSTKESYTFTPNSFLAIPEGAENLAVFNSQGKAVATFAIPNEKKQTSSATYTYGLLSDLHYDGSYNYVADKTVPAALAFFKSVGIQYVFSSGDYVTNAEEKYYQQFHDDIVASGVTFLGCGGNHEVVSGYERMFGKNGEIGYFQKYLNIGVYDGTLDGVLEFAPNGYDFAYAIPGNSSDIFVFVSQKRWDDGSVTMKPLIEAETYEWVGSVFEKYKDKTVHYFQHTYLSDDDGKHYNAEGDLANLVGTGYKGHFNKNTAEEKILRNLMAQYTNVIWYNGHSHWTYEMEKYNGNLNIFDNEGTSATMVHLPSVTNPRTIGDNDTSYTSNHGKLSMGMMTDVHNGYEIANGLNFTTGEICANAVYIIYGGEDHLISGTFENSETGYVFDKQLSSLRIVGSGAMPDFSENAPAPYAAYKDHIFSVYLSRPVTSIGNNAFSGLDKLTKAEIKDTVLSIGKGAFQNCALLSKLTLAESVEKIGENAFLGVSNPSINYTGTKEHFEKVTIAPGNDALKQASKAYGKYVITWKVGDYTKVEELEKGSVPQFGAAASMPTDLTDKYLPFSGWHNGSKLIAAGQALSSVKANVTYTAVFGKETDRYITGTTKNDKVTWTFDRYNGTLTVEGSGQLPDVDGKDSQPWAKYAKEIYTVIVKGTVSTVGTNNFCRMPVLTTIVFEKGVRDIRKDAFAYNDCLTTLFLPSSVTSIGQGASYQCKLLSNILFAGKAEKWDSFKMKITKIYNTVLTDATADDIICDATPPTDKTFTVTFLDDDGSTVKTVKNVKWGSGVIPPSVPDTESKQFIGWDSPYFVVTDNLTVKAMYKELPQTAPVSPSESTVSPSESSSDVPAPSESPVSGYTSASNGESDLPSSDLPSSDLPSGSETTSTPPSSNATQPGDKPEDSSNGNTGVLIGIVIGCLLLTGAVVITVIVLKKKKGSSF